MPQYMLLICNPTEGLSPDEAQAEHPKWMAYTQALSEAGALVSGEALQPVATATTVRVRGDERLVSDGPFAETKEALAGYYIIDVADLDDALDWAARIPSVTRGSVEVRPVQAFDMEMPAGERPGHRAVA
jgi:hypothetical protein